MKPFFHYALRTTDVAAARTFYASVLGKGDVEIFPLHEQAIARGARPHWLGFIDVGNVDDAASAFAARGATSLGPKWVNPQGLEAAVVRDPGGAVVALAKPPPAPSPGSTGVSLPAGPGVSFPNVIWHMLNTADVDRARANYGDLFGWKVEEPVAVASVDRFFAFAWRAGEAAVGAMADIAQRPEVHPHWIFHFRVAALDAAIAAVKAGGGLVLGPFVMPNGDRIAACDDAQGAAFGLLERPA